MASDSPHKLPLPWSLERKHTLPNLQFYYSSKPMREAPLEVDELDLDSLPAGKISLLRVELLTDALGDPVRIPVMIAKGSRPGPVLGVTAAVHGNELQGIPTIHSIFRDIRPLVEHDLGGILIGIPIVNIFGYHNNSRKYLDHVDLNRVMPGKKNGTISQQFCYYFMEKIVKKFNYLIDLHTASFGHVNSLYVRADMTHPVSSQMALLQNPQIIVHNAGEDGTLRSAAMALGIQSITIEIGNPQLFQNPFIERTHHGIFLFIDYLKMINLDKDSTQHAYPPPTICGRSYWIYTDVGGVLTVHPPINSMIKKGEVIASVVDIYGYVVKEYLAPEDGIIVGKTTNPSNHQGDRILHLGIPAPIESLSGSCPNVDDL